MAQLTRAQLLQLILDELPTNGNQEITAEKLRTVCDELVSSTNNIADDTLLASVVAGANITIDNTDPENPVISSTGGGGGTVNEIQGGGGLTITNPNGPTVTISGATIQAAAAAAQADATQAIADAADAENSALAAQVDATQALADAATAQATADSKVASVVAVTPNVTIDNTDPQNPGISVSQTTAGLLTNIYFTADQETTTEGTFYLTNPVDRGSTASSGNTNLVALTTPGVETSFPVDFLGPVATDPVLIPSGSYTGFITVEVSSNNGDQSFKIETYVCDSQGAPINAGGDVGSLGFETLNIAQSGRIDLTASREASVRMDTNQTFSYNLAVGQRTRYVVLVEKIGGNNTLKNVTLFSGQDFNSFFQVPILAPSQAYNLIQDEGVDLTQRKTIDFVGSSVTATDDPVNEKTIVTISGGGGGGSPSVGASGQLNSSDGAGAWLGIQVRYEENPFSNTLILGPTGGPTVGQIIGLNVGGDPLNSIGIVSINVGGAYAQRIGFTGDSSNEIGSNYLAGQGPGIDLKDVTTIRGQSGDNNASVAGGDVVITGGQGSAGGNPGNDGGSLSLYGGAPSGTGQNGIFEAGYSPQKVGVRFDERADIIAAPDGHVLTRVSSGFCEWQAPSGGGGVTDLQTAYAGGNVIVTNSADGQFEVSGTEQINLQAGTGQNAFAVIANEAGDVAISLGAANSGSGRADAFIAAKTDVSVTAIAGALNLGGQSVTASISGNTGAAGQFIGSDGAGGLQWSTPSGGGGGVSSVVAGEGINVDNTDPANPIVSSSLKGAIQTWSVASAESNQSMSGNITTGRAYAVVAIAEEDTSINSIEFFCAQNAGVGTYGVAIYDKNGIRQAYETGNTVSLGINVTQLTNDTGTVVNVPLLAGSAYYLVVESNINSLSLVARPSYNPPISASVPPLCFFVNNSRTVDPTGLPADISAFFGSIGAGVQNYWMLAYTT
jgi:hypothetical protein